MINQHNWAGFIPMLTNSAIPVFIGDPGRAKTFVAKALAESRDLTPVVFELGRAAMEEASGYPRITTVVPPTGPNREVMSYIPDERVDLCSHENCLVILDEFNQGTDDVYAAFQTLIQNLNETNLVCGFMNPVETSTNGRVLSDPIVSRCWIGEWEFNHIHWLDGIKEGGKFDSPNVPKLPSDWEKFIPACAERVHSFLSAHLECIPHDASNTPLSRGDSPRKAVRSDGDGKPYPTPRGWTAVMRSLAGAAAVGANRNTCFKIVEGLVGKDMADSFFKWDAQSGMQDIEEVIAGNEKLSLPVSGNLRLLMLTMLGFSLDDPSNRTTERYERCVEICGEAWEQDAAEYAMIAWGILNDTRPIGYRPKVHEDGTACRKLQDTLAKGGVEAINV